MKILCDFVLVLEGAEVGDDFGCYIVMIDLVVYVGAGGD